MRVHGLTPILNVSSIEQSFAWFAKLGWQKAWDWGSPPDVDAVHRRCLEHGLEITWPPTDMSWNTREMHVRHPDGHVFRVSQGIETAE